MARSPKLILVLASRLVRIDEAKAARPTLHQINGNEVLTTNGRRKSGRGSVPPIIMLCLQQLACLIINVDRDFLDVISCASRRHIVTSGIYINRDQRRLLRRDAAA